MVSAIGTGIFLLLFASFIISFFLTKPYQDKDYFLFWTGSISLERRARYALYSNFGASLSLFVFFCGEMMVAFCYGTIAAILMVASIGITYFGLWYMANRSNRLRHYMASFSDRRIKTNYSSMSIIDFVGTYYGYGVAIILTSVFLIFVFFGLISEITFFHNLLDSTVKSAEGPEGFSAIFTFLVVLICVSYVLRGGYECIFKTDVFQFALYVLVVSFFLFAALGLFPSVLSKNRSLWSVYVHHNNLLWPSKLGYYVLSIYLLICISFIFSSIDFWNRSMTFVGDYETMCRVLLHTAMLATFLSIFPITIGLYCRTYSPLLNQFLGWTDGFLTHGTFGGVTQMAFHPHFTSIFQVLPWYVTALAWAAITCLLLTTTDSLLVAVGQACKQLSVHTKAADLPRSPSIQGRLLSRLAAVLVFFGDRPRSLIALFAFSVAYLSSLIWAGPYAFSGLWAWNLLSFGAAVVIGALLVKQESMDKPEQAIATRRFRWIIPLWFLLFFANLAMAWHIEAWPASFQCLMTAFMALVFLIATHRQSISSAVRRFLSHHFFRR